MAPQMLLVGSSRDMSGVLELEIVMPLPRLSEVRGRGR